MDIIFTINRCPFLCAMHVFCSVHDASLGGQHLRPNQGIAFTLVGFRSWKKQHGSVLQHEACTSHRNSIVAQVKPHFYSKGQSSMLMSVERKILLTLPHEAIIQQIAQSSAELSRALL